MSFDATAPRADYVGNNSTPTYAYPWRIFNASNLKLIRTSTGGVETELVYLTDYTVAGVGDFGGGSITLTAGNLAQDVGLAILFDDDIKQPNDYRNQGGAFLEAIEDGLDLVTRYLQMLKERLDRTYHIPQSEVGTETLTKAPSVQSRKNKYMAWDADGNMQAVAGSPTAASTGQIHYLSEYATADLAAAGTGAIDQIGATQATLIVDIAGTCTLDKTVPSTLALIFVGQGKITVSLSKTLTINGTVQAPLRQIFAGSGTVSGFGAVITVQPEWWGALGDGSNDDRAAIQAAINSGCKVVMLRGGVTYLVGASGSTLTVTTVAQYYCLSVPANVGIWFNGAIVKAKNASNASVFINADAGTTDTDGVKLFGPGTIDCNQANQTAPATGNLAGIFFHRATNCRVKNIRVDNAREYAGRFLRSTGVWDDLYCSGSYGDGWSFGIEGSDTSVISNSSIDNIMAENCLGTYAGKNGNPIILTVQYCNIGKLWGKYSKGGVKFQDSTKFTRVGSIVEIGDTNGSTNSGVKIQGNNAGLTVQHLTIGEIHVTASYGVGLYMFDCTDISIGSYNGYGNHTNAAATDPADVYIKSTNTTRISIGTIVSRGCLQRAFTSESTGTLQVGSITSYNCNADNTPDRAIAFSGNTGTVHVGSMVVLDDNGTSNTTNLLNCSGSGIEMFVDTLTTNLVNSTAAARVSNGSGTKLYIKRFRMGSATQEGVVTLTNGATTTTVSNNSIAYFGTTGLYPIITLVPYNATAAALGLMRTIPVVYSTGTGFDIKMASNAGASDKVYWAVAGWSSTPGAVAT